MILVASGTSRRRATGTEAQVFGLSSAETQAAADAVNSGSFKVTYDGQEVTPVVAGPLGSNSDDGSDGLSGGAIAGIVIAVLIGCALIVVLLYFVVVRKRSSASGFGAQSSSKPLASQTYSNPTYEEYPDRFRTSARRKEVPLQIGGDEPESMA